MGWWNAAPDGSSLQGHDTGLIWGDLPADAIDDALERIVEYFRRQIGRDPSYDEIVAGVRFSIPNEEMWLRRLDSIGDR